MPNAKVLEEKKKIVTELADKMKSASSGVFVDYKGISVENDTKLRRNLREADVEYTVIKNTLLTLAAREAGFDELENVFKGPTAFAVSMTDQVAPARILNEYAMKDKEQKFKLKAGFVDGKVIDGANVKNLAQLPSREVMIAKMLGSFNAPITGFVNVLNGNLRGLVVALNAIAEQKA